MGLPPTSVQKIWISPGCRTSMQAGRPEIGLVELQAELLNRALDLDVLERNRLLERLGGHALGGFTAIGREPLHHLRGMHTVAYDAIHGVDDCAGCSRRRVKVVAIR